MNWNAWLGYENSPEQIYCGDGTFLINSRALPIGLWIILFLLPFLLLTVLSNVSDLGFLIRHPTVFLFGNISHFQIAPNNICGSDAKLVFSGKRILNKYCVFVQVIHDVPFLNYTERFDFCVWNDCSNNRNVKRINDYTNIFFLYFTLFSHTLGSLGGLRGGASILGYAGYIASIVPIIGLGMDF